MILTSIQTLNDLLTAGIAVTAFSLLIYALSFNLRDRVARSFAFIMLCVVIVYVADLFASVTASAQQLNTWLRLQWLGIIFLPAAYLHISDALLETTGRPSRGRRRRIVRLNYIIAFAFLLTLPFGLVGPLVQNVELAPHLQRTWLTWLFTVYYALMMGLAWANFWRAYQRTVTSTSRRRMGYLIAGALAPALGSYPYLLFGSGFAARYQLVFWLVVTISNLLVSALLIVMAYAVAFFGVPWPDRVVKRRLAKWLMRGPVTASSVLAVTTVLRRLGFNFGLPNSAIVPVAMVFTILIMEHVITFVAPLWERWLFNGGDRGNMDILQTLEERLLTTGDLRQFLEAVLAAVVDRLQVDQAFVAALSSQGVDFVVTIGGDNPFENEDLSTNLLQVAAQNGLSESLFSSEDYWFIPLLDQESRIRRAAGLTGRAAQCRPGPGS